MLRQEVKGQCRCGQCCRRLIIEVGLEDAQREPRIKECGSPIRGFSDEVEGYLLNSHENDYACAFLDRATNLCTIYPTRPLLLHTIPGVGVLLKADAEAPV